VSAVISENPSGTWFAITRCSVSPWRQPTTRAGSPFSPPYADWTWNLIDPLLTEPSAPVSGPSRPEGL
jgi:hypothetical protein